MTEYTVKQLIYNHEKAFIPEASRRRKRGYPV